MAASSGPGFVVLYRWRLHPGKEQQFIQAWSVVSDLLQQRGSLGSRLHRGPEDTWYSYAQWPSESAREQAFSLPSVDADAMAKMCEAIAESLPELVLEPVVDYMVLEHWAREPATTGAVAETNTSGAIDTTEVC